MQTFDEYFSKEAFNFAKDQTKSPKSKWTLIYMKPSDFLKVAAQGRNETKEKGVRELIANNTKFQDIPHLIFVNNGDKTATIVGHEGRHRSLVLKELGDKPMPVTFVCSEGGKGPVIRWGVANDPNDYDYVEKWPKILYAEQYSGIKIPFPESTIYPRNNKIESGVQMASIPVQVRSIKQRVHATVLANRAQQRLNFVREKKCVSKSSKVKTPNTIQK